MSPLSGGLAEVDHRLRYLQRRLNEFTVLHALCLGMSGLALLSAGLILLGLRADAATFRVGTGAAVLLVAAVGLVCAVYLWRRWMDMAAAAWVADRRGHLTDRLTTLMALQARPGSSPLMPVLVKQTLALSRRWQPNQIQPRRLPRSAFVLLASLLALASTAFVSRRLVPPPVSEPAPQAPPEPKAGAIPAPAAARENKRGAAGNQAAGQIPDASNLALDGAHADAGEGKTGGSGERPDDRSPVSNTALPDRLQAAIRQAFKAEPLGRPRQLASRPQPSFEEASQDRHGGEGGAGQEPHARKPADPRTENPGTASGRAQKGESESGKPGGQGGKRDDPAGTEQRHAGAAPGAGSESSPGGLMGPEGSEPGVGSDGSKTFKLTITSFLRALEQKGRPQRPSGKRVGTSRVAPEGGGTAALSDRQLADDLLRKAEIPPEYEDIVRRVYSARASK